MVKRVRTRAQGDREEKEDKEKLKEATKGDSGTKDESHKRSKLQSGA